MVEVTMTWDLRPDIDVEACTNFSKVAVSKVLQVPGCREFRAHRNVLGSPHVRATYVWQSLGECANFQQTDAWQALVPELNEYATHVENSAVGTVSGDAGIAAPRFVAGKRKPLVRSL